ncbi:hypothetical protein [Larkinella terrae]|uniref:Uncharacterized protein n=1 Tax=Larkinella terrae TaxID=2025311 RepID=A0A7K0EHI2_9BACT|nr:hypothetical protein [Larkinella terrae]MRS60928.1 hypothetical protein [Larkinella terrae]
MEDSVTHPWLTKYPIKRDSTNLILGTHPPMPYKAELKFYYGNKYNFWKLLKVVFPQEQLFTNNKPNLALIQQFLKNHKFSITDIVYKTNGQKFSTDDEMIWTSLNPFLKGWLEKSSIENIYITSFSGKNGTLSLFKKWIKQYYGKNIRIPPTSSWREKAIFNFNLGDKEYRLIKLYSPSARAKTGISNSIPYIEWLNDNPNGNADQFRIFWYTKYLNYDLESQSIVKLDLFSKNDINTILNPSSNFKVIQEVNIKVNNEIIALKEIKNISNSIKVFNVYGDILNIKVKPFLRKIIIQEQLKISLNTNSWPKTTNQLGTEIIKALKKHQRNNLTQSENLLNYSQDDTTRA